MPPAAFPVLRSKLLRIAIACALSAPAYAQSTDVQALERRLRVLEQRLGIDSDTPVEGEASAIASLEQRLAVIERKLELQAEVDAAKAQTKPTVSLNDKGLSVKSSKNDLEVKFRTLLQADGRFFVDDQQVPQNDGFLIRRAEPVIEGSWGSLIGFKLGAQFAGDTATINDAHLDLKFDPRATVRLGKFKTPVSLERLQSSSSLALVEQGLATELAPGRDLGVQLQGEFFSGELNYAAGVFNGAVDGRDGVTSNPDNEFEYAGRVFWEPFKSDENAASGLGLGVAASTGFKRGAGNNFLPRYRTPGQAQFFNYGSNIVAAGAQDRLSPQAHFFSGAFGLQGEYVVSKQRVRIANGADAGRSKQLEHDAYQLTASYVLSGEDASYKGVVKPSAPFTIDGDGWGAFELVPRYGELDIDDDTFPLYANRALVASQVTAWGVGLNWYLNSNLKLVLNYTQARFEDGGPANGDREDEKAVFTRAQLSF